MVNRTAAEVNTAIADRKLAEADELAAAGIWRAEFYWYGSPPLRQRIKWAWRLVTIHE